MTEKEQTKEQDEKERLAYTDLEFPTFVNTRPAASLTAYTGKQKEDGSLETEIITLPFCDIPKITTLIGGSALCIGDTRCGKSLMMMDIHRNYFGGDADNGGKSNWHVARNDFSAENYFMTLDQSKIGERKGILAEARVPVERRVRALCNHIDEINLAIPEVQVEFFGIAEGRHKGAVLGERDYNLCMASCNLNRINGDFAGTSQINRALLNRMGITLDFDYFRETDEDKNTLAGRNVSGRLELAPIRDISEKILEVYRKIKEDASKREPWLDAYIRFLSSALEYCHKDSDKRKKKIWPSKCGDCDFGKKDLCSLVKHSNIGTLGLLKRFAVGMDYLVKLKHSERNLDPLDLVLESYKFTTYHGNLNGVETLSTYGGEDQEQMRDVVTRLRDAIQPVKPYVDSAVNSAVNGNPETRFIEISVSGKPPQMDIYSDEKIKQLKKLRKKGVSYRVFSPFEDRVGRKTFEERTGIRVDWLPKYLESIAQDYEQHEQQRR